MSDIRRFSSRRRRLDHAFLSQKLESAKSYRRIAGYFRSSIFELVGEEISTIAKVQRSFVTLFLQHRETFGRARRRLADEVGVSKTLSLAASAMVSVLLDDAPVLVLCPSTPDAAMAKSRGQERNDDDNQFAEGTGAASCCVSTEWSRR
jgi:hypothetical protein